MIANDNKGIKHGRSGNYVSQIGGYKAFAPKPLPPDPSIQLDSEMILLLSQAAMALGRLDGMSATLPNVDLFVAMYVNKEAVLSSQIEGTQASLIDVLAFEADAALPENPQDIEEVVNYINALNYGLRRLSTLPLSLRLIREIHSLLLQGVREDPSLRWSEGCNSITVHAWTGRARKSPSTAQPREGSPNTLVGWTARRHHLPRDPGSLRSYSNFS